MSLLQVADILRCIFSQFIETDPNIYSSVRLTCKHFKNVLDTLSIRKLVYYVTNTRGMNIPKLLLAPKEVIRLYLLVHPISYLNSIQYHMFYLYTLHADPTNRLFCYYVRHPSVQVYNNLVHDSNEEEEEDEPDDSGKYWGCRIEYHTDTSYERLLEILQFYLGFDNEMRIAYKTAVIELLTAHSLNAVCRELFARIGSLLPFTEKELATKVEFVPYALLNRGCCNTDTYDENGVEEAVRNTEEIEDDRLYLDEERMIFRFHDPILEEQNTDPQYWSIATLRTWIDRVCYD